MKQGSGRTVLVAVGLLAAGLWAAAEARAPGGANDCAALEQAVFTAVLGSSEARRPAGVRAGIAYERLFECTATARAVSTGFTRAMARGNIYLTFQWERERGDICLSGDLSQCYPRGNPFVPIAHADAAFVADSWFAVVRAVGKAMPRGYVTDVCRYTGAGMARALAAELDRRTRGRLRQAYDTP